MKGYVHTGYSVHRPGAERVRIGGTEQTRSRNYVSEIVSDIVGRTIRPP